MALQNKLLCTVGLVGGLNGQRATAFVEVNGVHVNVRPDERATYAANCSASSGLAVPPATTLSTCV